MRARRRQGPIAIVEAAYRSCSDGGAWLDGMLASAGPVLDRGLGLIAYEYGRGADGRLQVGPPRGHGASAASLVAFTMATRTSAPALLEQAYFGSRPCTTLSEIAGADEVRTSPLAIAYGALSGVRDYLALKADDGSGQGIALGVLLPAVGPPPPRERWRLERLIAHIASASRLRRSPAPARRDGLPPGTEAVVDPARGRVVHAEGIARAATAAIAENAARIERARACGETEAALRAWRPLLLGRWSISDHLEMGGRRFLVARQNPPGEEPLTDREAQVLAFTAAGHSPKLIGYELDLSPSTVHAHEQHAMAKLGARTRLELIALLAATAISGRARAR